MGVSRVRSGGWLLLALLVGCNAGCVGPTPADAAAADAGDAFLDAVPSGAFYRDGQLVLSYELDGRQAFFSAAWPMEPAVAGQHSFHMALMAFSKEAPVPPTELARDWQPVALRDYASWQALVGVLLERFAPADPATAWLVNVQAADLVLHRDPAGQLQIHRREDKPAGLRVTRYITEEAFSAAANDHLRQELSADGNVPGPVLFAVGEDEFGSAFVLFDFAHAQSVFIALEPDPAGPMMGLDFSIRMLDALTLRSHGYSAIRQPVTMIHRLFWLTAHSGMAALPRGTSVVHAAPPVAPGEPMDLEKWERELDRLVGRHRYRGSIKALIDGEAFFEALIQSIVNAEKSVDIRLYIFDRDDYALRIADLLKQRSSEIKVRVLIDRIGTLSAGHLPQGSPYHSRADPQLFIADYLREDSKVEVRLVDNPWLTSDHTKVIVIDRHTAFVGGMNIGHEYRYKWHDMMVEVHGPIVKRLSKDFDKRWAHTGFGGDLAFAIAAMKPGRYRGPADGPDFVEMRPLYTRTGDPQILRAQVAAIRAARARIYIQQPYFSDDQLIAELIRARQRGVDVRVVLPSQSDSGFMDSANLITARALARNGIRVYVYPGMTHVKAALYDGWAIVGSANFDKLSLRINQETNLATSDPGFAASLERELFDVDFSQSREWSSSEPVRWRDYIGKAIAEQL
jgi:cardiolipin synthase A/B